MNNEHHRDFINAAVKVLSEDERILFAYLYGSTLSGDKSNDIDIAVYMKTEFFRRTCFSA